jgi:hypothetical protein
MATHHLVLLLPALLSACGDSRDSPGEVSVGDAEVVDATLPDAETDPCIPRELGIVPGPIALLGAGEELLVSQKDLRSFGASLWQAKPGGWQWSTEDFFYDVWPGRDRIWVRTDWNVVTAIGLDGEEQIQVALPFEIPSHVDGIEPRVLAEALDGSVLIGGWLGHDPEIGDPEEFDPQQAILLAFDGATGEERWRATLPHPTGFNQTTLTEVFAASDGRIFALGELSYHGDFGAPDVLMASFSPQGDRLSFDTWHDYSFEDSDDTWHESALRPRMFADNAGRVSILATLDGRLAITDSATPDTPIVELPEDPDFMGPNVPLGFWSLGDDWLVVRGLQTADFGGFGEQIQVLRVDPQGGVRWQRRYDIGQSLYVGRQHLALVGDRLHLLMGQEGGDLQVTLDLEGGCQVAPRLVFPYRY